ncbi:MAG: MFS transporter [Acidimicrobiia bacterium]|nr:MFS transporter [Acidimicrobiia bacterium]
MEPSALGPSYARLWTAYVISSLGNGLLLAALPLLATSITRNPLAIAGLTAAAGLPWLLVGPLSGAIADRVDRRRAMAVAEFCRAAVVGLAALFVLGGGESLLFLYLVLIMIGIGETIYDPIGLVMVPSLVGPSQLDRANSLLYGSQTLVQRFVGPPLGGWLFALAVWAPLGIDALSFLVSALVVLTLPKTPSRPDPEWTIGGFSDDVMEGLRWVWRDRALRALMLGDGALHFTGAAATSVLVLVAQDRFELGALGFGLTLGALAGGHILGSALAPTIVKRFQRAKVCVASVAAAGGGFLLVAVSDVALLGGLGLAVVGFAGCQLDIVSVTYRQAAVPDRIRGRVMAGVLFVCHGSVPLGAIFGGLVATVVDVRYTYVAAALVAAAVAPYLRRALKDTELDPGSAGLASGGSHG